MATPSVLDTFSDLSKRWTLSRNSSVRSVMDLKDESEFFSQLTLVSEDDFEAVLKALFLNSRTLGRGYQRATQLTWEMSDFVVYLSKMGVPCLLGQWRSEQNACVLSRAGCDVGRRLGSRYCRYWREATDGLVLGLSDDVGYVRNSSLGSGEASCVDVFYLEEQYPTDAIWKSQYRWGELPSVMKPDLLSIESVFKGLKIELKFLGLSDGHLFYKLESKENLTCGSAGSIYRGHLKKLVLEKFPFVSLKDASPIAVYGEKA